MCRRRRFPVLKERSHKIGPTRFVPGRSVRARGNGIVRFSAIARHSAALNRIDETQVVTLEGNVHPLARAEFDQGPVNPDTRLERMVLLLKPSPAQQTALDALVEAQQNPDSPLYHQWLTPAEYGAQFGVSEPELAQVTAWLAAQGFTVDEIPAGRQLVVFSGTAGQVFDAFHTEMHVYRVNGAEHIANAQDPQIPAALAGVVGGVVSLHDFRRTIGDEDAEGA